MNNSCNGIKKGTHLKPLFCWSLIVLLIAPAAPWFLAEVWPTEWVDQLMVWYYHHQSQLIHPKYVQSLLILFGVLVMPLALGFMVYALWDMVVTYLQKDTKSLRNKRALLVLQDFLQDCLLVLQELKIETLDDVVLAEKTYWFSIYEGVKLFAKLSSDMKNRLPELSNFFESWNLYSDWKKLDKLSVLTETEPFLMSWESNGYMPIVWLCLVQRDKSIERNYVHAYKEEFFPLELQQLKLCVKNISAAIYLIGV